MLTGIIRTYVKNFEATFSFVISRARATDSEAIVTLGLGITPCILDQQIRNLIQIGYMLTPSSSPQYGYSNISQNFYYLPSNRCCMRIILIISSKICVSSLNNRFHRFLSTFKTVTATTETSLRYSLGRHKMD